MAKDDVRSCTYNFGALYRELLQLPAHIRQTRLYGMAPSTIAFARRQIEFGLEHSTERSVARYLKEYGGSEPTGNQWEIAEAAQFPAGLIMAPLDRIGPGPRVVFHGKGDYQLMAAIDLATPLQPVE